MQHTLKKSTWTLEMRKSEADVKRILNAFDHFINPFRISQGSSNLLYCISSGQTASKEISDDLLGCVQYGEKAAVQFTEDHLISHKVDFHDSKKKKT